jgi:guanylate kinase
VYAGDDIISQILKQNKVCILDIDVQGVRNVKKSTLNCKYVFIDAPDFEELKNRLVGRGTETAEKIQIRLKNSEEEIAYGREEGNFDRILVNNDLNETYAALVGQLHSWFSELPLNN